MPACTQRVWCYPTPAFSSIALCGVHGGDARDSLGLGRVHFLNQVHGSALVPFPTNGQQNVQTGDAWLWGGEFSGFALQAFGIAGAGAGFAEGATQDFVGLAIRTADCVPALLLDADSGAGALLHLGRRGIEGRLLPKAIQAIQAILAIKATKNAALREKPLRLGLYLGPSIGPCCYEVPVAMAEEFCHSNAANCSAACVQMRDGCCFLDLRQAIAEQAQQAEGCGVVLKYTCPDCTSCLAQKYIANPETQVPCYSYRCGHKTERIISFVRFVRPVGKQAIG